MQGCQQIWRAVTDLWRQQDQQPTRQPSSRTKAQRLAHRDLLREEADLMEHEVEGLHPLEGQTYLRAMEELTLETGGSAGRWRS